MAVFSRWNVWSKQKTHPESSLPSSKLSHMLSHVPLKQPGPHLCPKILRALCPSGTSVGLCWKMNSAQKFYSSWRLYLKGFSTVLAGVSHFGCVRKQTLCARKYKFWLDRTTLKPELQDWIPTKFDSLNQIAQIFSAAKTKAEFCPESFLSFLNLQQSLTGDLSSF